MKLTLYKVDSIHKLNNKVCHSQLFTSELDLKLNLTNPLKSDYMVDKKIYVTTIDLSKSIWNEMIILREN